MKKLLEISLGVVTSVGGFLEVGSMATAAQAGALFGFQLIWAVVLGTICIIFLVEMAGRFAAVSHHTIADGIRERFGFNAFILPLLATLLVNFLVLSAEIGGVAIAAELATGISFQWWALPVAFLAWLLLWKGTFGLIEKGVSMLGLVTLCFVVGAVMLRPEWKEVAVGAVPSLPHHDTAKYWFMAVSILGASISPYLFMFYSSGAIEDQWDKSYLGTNRAIAGLGMSFGGTISVGVLIVAALVLGAHGVAEVDDYNQLPLMLIPIFGFWGFVLFVASLAIACFGAALEVALQQAYLVAQGFGWNWGEDLKPRDDPGFSLAYTLTLFLAAIPIVLGLDPLKLTIFSMALTAASLPLTVVPFLFLLNDERYVGEHRNGPHFERGRDLRHLARLRAGGSDRSAADIRRHLMQLLRDILDKQVVDREQVKIGKVDGLVAELRRGKPPKVVAIELGSISLARRLGVVPGRWTARLAARLSGKRQARPHRIGWNKVRDIGVDIEFDIDVRRTRIFSWQDWLREHVVGRIPGA